MPNMLDTLKRMFSPVLPLKPGIYHYQAPPDSSIPYRLHLRLEQDGSGILIVNASTILHLNQTAAEFAYHMINQSPEEMMVREFVNRYKVNRQTALQDYLSLKERIQSLINTPDLDPETFLDFARTTPNSNEISAPYRLDCAVTYRLSGSIDDSVAPTKRVDRELSTQEWTDVFDKAWKFGIPHIILTGGEPTLRDDLSSLIAHTESNGQVVGLLSDGLKFVDQSYLRSLLQTGLDHVMLLLKPEDPDSWKALEVTLAADVYVVVHLTLTLVNVIDISQVLNRLSKMGVKAISLSASDTALHNTLIQCRNEAAALGLSLVWDLPVPYSGFNPVALETQVDNPPEGAGHAWLYIEPDGDVLPAQGVNKILGNILQDDWNKLWC